VAVTLAPGCGGWAVDAAAGAAGFAVGGAAI